MLAHIESTLASKNADPKCTHLNRERINFPKIVSNRTEAIQHWLEMLDCNAKSVKIKFRLSEFYLREVQWKCNILSLTGI